MGSYSVWQPTETRTLGATGGTESTVGGWVGVFRTGGGGSGLDVEGFWTGAGGGEAFMNCRGGAGTGS